MARGRNEKPENAGIEKQPRNGQVRVESEVLWDDSKAFCQIGYPRGHRSSRYPIAFGPPAPGPRDVGMSGCMVSLAGWLVG